MRFSTVQLFLLAGVAGLSPAAEFTAQLVDGLNRPISGVNVAVSCVSPKHKAISINLKSNEDGFVYSTYNAANCKPLSVAVSKEDYESYFSGFRSRYVMKRRFGAQEVSRVVRLDDASREREFRELLAGNPNNENQFRESVFYFEARLRPVLRVLARNPLVTERARYLLSLIAVPEDLQLMLHLPTPPPSLGFPERWRYAVATALVNPDDEDEWSFLRKCALNEFNDRWVDAGAIQTLKLTGSLRSRKILEEAQQTNQVQASRIASALDYVGSSSPTLADVDLQALAKRVAQALELGTWERNGAAKFNEAGDKALVDFTFQTSMDVLIYTATFHRIDGTWTLRGSHETYQGFSPRPVPIRREK